MKTIRRSMRPIGSTVVLTVLIWMYADQITSYTVTELVRINVKAQPGSDMNVELQQPANEQLEVTFTGPRVKIEDLRKDLSTGKLKIDYYVPAEGVTGDTVTRDAIEVVSSILHKDYNMITVAEVKPAQIQVLVDRLTTVEMPVKILSVTTKTSPPVITPPTVKVTMSDFVYKNLSESERYVELENLDNELRNRPEDREINEFFTVLQRVAGQQVTTDPTQVNVKLRIQRHLPTKSFEITRIYVMGPPDFTARYSVVIPNQQITLELKGPEEDIKNLQPQDIIAYLRFEREDMYKSVGKMYTGDVQLILPPRITMDTEKMPRIPSVPFKLINLQPANPAEP